MFDGITEMLIIVIFEVFLVIVAMGCDFSSGYYKAKLRKEAQGFIRFASHGQQVYTV